MNNSQVLPQGTLLSSKERTYKIKTVLGQGGFGITYLATSQITVGNISTEASFCIKEHYIQSMNERRGTSVIISNPNNIEDVKNSLEAFLAEARRLNSLSRFQANIVRVNEVFEANDTAYYVMQYINGQKLGAYVKSHDGGCLPEAEAIRLTAEVGEALSFLHKNNLTHLDVKPDNIMLNEDKKPMLIDFGLAKHYDKKGRPTSSIKISGLSMGYAPMEQYVGITEFTPEADVYALAATLCFMLTGQHPPVSTKINGQVIAQMLEGHASPSTIAALQHAMESLKVNRTHSIAGFLEELQGKRTEKSAAAHNVLKPTVNFDGLQLDEVDITLPSAKPEMMKSGSTVISNPSRRSKKKKYLLAAAVAAVVAVAAFMLLPHREKNIELIEIAETFDIDDAQPLIKNLKIYLDEKNSVSFNQQLEDFESITLELIENQSDKTTDYVGAVRDFLTQHEQEISENLGFSSETMKKMDVIQKGTVEEYIRDLAKRNSVALPEDIDSEQTHESKQRIW